MAFKKGAVDRLIPREKNSIGTGANRAVERENGGISPLSAVTKQPAPICLYTCVCVCWVSSNGTFFLVHSKEKANDRVRGQKVAK